MANIVRGVARRLKRWLTGETPQIATWKQRAASLNARGVFNAGHDVAELDGVTAMQKQELYPRLRGLLDGTQRVVLDFGCGTGRFSGDLADLVQGQVIAADPIQHFLDMAPKHPRVSYRLMSPGKIPAETASIDVLWVCLVLGGIQGKALRQTVSELRRVLKPNGLVFLVENTTNAVGNSFWTFRTIDWYRDVLPGTRLDVLGEYVDLGERISIFAGRW